MNRLSILLLVLVIFGCQSNTTQSGNEIAIGDTIKTASGLQYIYLKKGEGRQIETGSKVAAYMRLFLNDVDTVFWASEDNEDSTFRFIQGKTSMIDGADELYTFLRKGDEVIAIMPDSIAYGKEDSRGLPGGSTLIFNPIIIKSVSEPKLSLSDTLLAAFKERNTDFMISEYQRIMDSEEREKYHLDMDLISMDVLGDLLKNKNMEAVMEMAKIMKTYASNTIDLQSVRQYEAWAAYQNGELERSMKIVDKALADEPENAWFNQVKSSLEEELSKK